MNILCNISVERVECDACICACEDFSDCPLFFQRQNTDFMSFSEKNKLIKQAYSQWKTSLFPSEGGSCVEKILLEWIFSQIGPHFHKETILATKKLSVDCQDWTPHHYNYTQTIFICLEEGICEVKELECQAESCEPAFPAINMGQREYLLSMVGHLFKSNLLIRGKQ